jgi:hypothetical protein
MASSIEESNCKSSFKNEFIWEYKTNDDPWDERQTPQWTYYSKIKSLAIEQAYKNKFRDISIDENYRIDLENYIQQQIDDESARCERLSSPLGLVLSCSATGDTMCYGSAFIHAWLLMITEGKMEITFDTIYPLLRKGLIKEGQTDTKKNLSEIKAALSKVEEETRKKSSKKRIEELQKCCAKLYTKPCFIYRVVNTALRDDDRSKLHNLGPFCYLLFNHIGRPVKYSSRIHDFFQRFLDPNVIESIRLYRGDDNSNNIIEEYRRAVRDNSKHFKWLPFVSTSRDRTVAEKFAVDVLYIIEIRSYSLNEDRFTDLSEISHFRNEQEILLLPGVQFQVNKVSFDNEKGLHLVYIKINSSYISKLK